MDIGGRVVNWGEFIRAHPDAGADIEVDADGIHGTIGTDNGGRTYISIGDGQSMILAALHEALTDC